MDWLDLPAVQGTLMSLLQHDSSKASILQHSAFFTVQLSHPYMTTGKTIALTRQTFVGKLMSLSRLVITFLPRSKHLLISWLQSPSAVILESPQNKVWHCFHCFPIYLPRSVGTRCHGAVIHFFWLPYSFSLYGSLFWCNFEIVYELCEIEGRKYLTEITHSERKEFSCLTSERHGI